MPSGRATDVVTKYFRRFALDSIRNKILLFAVLATLLPSGITALISYTQTRRQLDARINKELVTMSQQTAREIRVWLRERVQELRTVGASREVSEALDPGRPGNAASRGRVNEYLRSVRGRLPEYAELVVLDLQGRSIVTTAPALRPVPLPPEALRLLRENNPVVGEASWDSASRGGRLVLAVPVLRTNMQRLGALAARVPLSAVQQQLIRAAAGTEARLYLVGDDGAVIAGSTGGSADLMAMKLSPGSLERLTRNDSATVTYSSATGDEAVGALKTVQQFPWAVVAEIPAATAFREVRRFRNLAAGVVAGLLLVVSVIAYWLGRVIVRPLDRLTRGAAEVASGDLAVDLPAGGGGEVGLLTDVFNEMVARLRESRKQLDARNETLQKQNEELEELSTTDGLTGLFNRRHLNSRLSEEVTRSRRNKQTLSALMIDVDHFKSYNDTHGHPAGDEVLKRVAELLREATREVDCAARYGGEEFCVLLPETSAAAAVQVAERIRTRVAGEKFTGRPVTISIGLAEFGKNGDTPEAVIAAADAALYQAKRAGRDRVVRAK